MKIKETDIQRQILDHLNSVKERTGIFFWRQNNIAAPKRKFTGLKGVPDIFVILPPHGTLISIECKTEKGKLSEHQKSYKKEVSMRGGIYVEARSVSDVEFLSRF